MLKGRWAHETTEKRHLRLLLLKMHGWIDQSRHFLSCWGGLYTAAESPRLGVQQCGNTARWTSVLQDGSTRRVNKYSCGKQLAGDNLSSFNPQVFPSLLATADFAFSLDHPLGLFTSTFDLLSVTNLARRAFARGPPQLVQKRDVQMTPIRPNGVLLWRVGATMIKRGAFPTL